MQLRENHARYFQMLKMHIKLFVIEKYIRNWNNEVMSDQKNGNKKSHINLIKFSKKLSCNEKRITIFNLPYFAV